MKMNLEIFGGMCLTNYECGSYIEKTKKGRKQKLSEKRASCSPNVLGRSDTASLQALPYSRGGATGSCILIEVEIYKRMICFSFPWYVHPVRAIVM